MEHGVGGGFSTMWHAPQYHFIKDFILYNNIYIILLINKIYISFNNDVYRLQICRYLSNSYLSLFIINS